MLARALATLVVLALAPTAPNALAQAPCGEWQDTFAAPGPDDVVQAWAVFDDGTGPALYAVGFFDAIGDQRLAGVARWNGTSWAPLGAGLPGARCLAVYDDGSGPQLYAGGNFRIALGAPGNTVARWNGTSWSALAGAGPDGINDTAYVMQVFDDGSGPALFVGGSIGLPGMSPNQRVVRWDGATWTTTGGGLGAPPQAMTVFDPGTGALLYAAASVSGAAGGLHVWSGSSWAPTTPALPNAAIEALATYTDAGGTAIYAAGQFGTISGTTYNSIARFDGISWSTVGGGLTVGLAPGFVSALVVHDEGTGPRLVAGGIFQTAGGTVPVNGLASWDGAVWRSIDPGPSVAQVLSLASFDGGSGPGLYVSGTFERAGRVAAARAAVWRAGEWHRLAAGEGMGSWVERMLSFDDGTGPALYAGGLFQAAGTTLATSIARWNGVAWSALGSPLDTDGPVYGLGTFDSGSGPRLHAGGGFTRIGGTSAGGVARWDGSSWAPLGLGTDGSVRVFATFDAGSGPELYAGGQFALAGGAPAANIARWNGTSWSALGSGTNFPVRDLLVHDDGSGAALYACGDFSLAGGLNVPRVARWDGTAWSAVGSSILPGSGLMNDLQVYDSGSGPELYMSGGALLAGGEASVVRWDGATWSAAGVLPPDNAIALAVLHDGNGPRLYASFLHFSPVEMTIHAWDGVLWTALPGTVEGQVTSLCAHDAESDGVADLYVGGGFSEVGDVPSSNLALWRSCGTVGSVQCAGDGSGAACPCNNTGASGHGCANSLVAAGAVLANGGVASLANDTLELDASGMTGTSALFFQGTTAAGGGAGVPFDDGLLCASGTVVRLTTAPMSGGAASVPQAGDPSLSVRGQITGPGDVRTYQVRYRNMASFCTPATSNLSNGLRIAWSL